MFKRLIAVLMALAMAACTAIPVYADAEILQGVTISLENEETAGIGENGETQQGETPSQADGDSNADGSADSQEGSEPSEGDADSSTSGSENDASEEPAEKDEDKTDDKEDTDKKETTKKEVSKYQKGLAAYIRSKNKNLSKDWSITLAGYFIKHGEKNDIDPKVLMALARRESNFRAKAKSVYGYKGMMQCNDSLARRYGYKPSDLYKANVSIEIAAKYLKAMKKKYGTYSKALSCYICGSGAVARGTYSKAPARSVMNMRDGIKDFLKEKGYTS